MWHVINQNLKTIDNLIWGLPLMLLILSGGLWLTIRLGLLQVRRLPLALKWMVRNEEGGKGEVSSFAALCTALSATIGTGNIVGVATAIGMGGSLAAPCRTTRHGVPYRADTRQGPARCRREHQPAGRVPPPIRLSTSPTTKPAAAGSTQPSPSA